MSNILFTCYRYQPDCKPSIISHATWMDMRPVARAARSPCQGKVTPGPHLLRSDAADTKQITSPRLAVFAKRCKDLQAQSPLTHHTSQAKDRLLAINYLILLCHGTCVKEILSQGSHRYCLVDPLPPSKSST